MNDHNCTNCNSIRTEVIGIQDSQSSFVLTSDAQSLTDVIAFRIICRDCSCVSTKFDPADSIEKFYNNTYNISDSVQNHYIVTTEGVKENKHHYLKNRLFSALPADLESGNILEIACGKGDLIKSLHDFYSGCNCFGIDPSIKRNNEVVGNNIKFIQDQFKLDYFKGIRFDIIIAHGFLNRSPILKELINIRKCSKMGTILSLELMLIENSECLPFIWDHSFVCTEEVFNNYLKQTGFSVISKEKLGSTFHYLCVGENTTDQYRDDDICENHYKETLSIFNSHELWWEKIKNKLIVECEINTDKRIALFGAGMYSAILINWIREYNLPLSFIIDENKHGSTLFNIPVYSFNDIVKESCHVMLCTRPDYLDTMIHKLKKYGITYTILNP